MKHWQVLSQITLVTLTGQSMAEAVDECRLRRRALPGVLSNT